jgi:TusA-related sulfurtransferase
VLLFLLEQLLDLFQKPRNLARLQCRTGRRRIQRRLGHADENAARRLDEPFGEEQPREQVKVKLALAELQSGEELDVLLNEGEPLNNVPRTAAEQGHQVLSIRQEDGFHHVLIRKA